MGTPKRTLRITLDLDPERHWQIESGEGNPRYVAQLLLADDPGVPECVVDAEWVELDPDAPLEAS